MDNNYQDMSLFDFIVLCIKKLKALFILLFKALHHIITVGWKYWYLVICCMILGVLFAWFWAKPQFTRFKGEATVVFPDGMKSTMESGIESFFCESPEAVGLTWTHVKKLKRFRYFNNVDAKCDKSVDFIDRSDKVESTDSLCDIVMDRLTIQLEMRDCSRFYDYEVAMRNYFNQREEYREPARRWRESMKRRIEWIDREIARTDSFIDYDYFHKRNTVILRDSISLGTPAEMHYEDAQKLIEERERLVEKLAATPDVINFQTHFHASAMLIYMKYFYSLLVSFAIGLLIAYVIEYRKEINEYLQLKR